MDLERYNQSFEEHVDTIEQEAENRLRSFRQQCVRNFISNFTKNQREWDATFRELLGKSQQLDTQAQTKLFEDTKSLEHALNLKLGLIKEKEECPREVNELPSNNNDNTPIIKETPVKTKLLPVDPFPKELSDYFTNNLMVKEFLQLQQKLEANRQQFGDIEHATALKPFKTEMNLFIRTQINSISNSDREHLNTKTRMLSNLFMGQQVTFQDRIIQASRHPNGQMYAMNLAAETFVTVGTRLVNSVPAIAKSMATVINDISTNTDDLHHFNQLVLGNLQERCPYLVPLSPTRDKFDDEVRYKIACGYIFESKSKALESEDKYIARMRSMVLMYSCILAEQQDKGPAWTWLASFLSLEPERVITATVLQAFLQEASKSLSKAYKRQYKKLLNFIKTDYVHMIEQVTTNASDRQTLIKLKNLLADEKSLMSPALFRRVRFS